MKLAITALALSCASLSAQVADSPLRFNYETWVKQHKYEVSLEYAARLGDAYTTYRFENNPCKCMHEVELPNAIAKHSPAMFAYSIGAATTETLISYRLSSWHHTKLAKSLLWIDIGVATGTDIHNAELKRKK